MICMCCLAVVLYGHLSKYQEGIVKVKVKQLYCHYTMNCATKMVRLEWRVSPEPLRLSAPPH